VNEQVAAAVLRVEVNGRLPADRVERLGGDCGEGGVLRIPRVIIPGLRLSALQKKANAKGRDNE
jgi:hypothetical protein